MIINNNVKCCNCDSIFRLRWQVGFNKAEINILCPRCKTPIFVSLEIKDLSLVTSYMNVVNCTDSEQLLDGNYLVEMSTEFFTKKITSNTDRLLPENAISPFIRSFCSYNRDKSSILIPYGLEIRKIKNMFETISSMYINKSMYYLKKALLNNEDKYATICKNSINNYRLNTDVDYLIGTHHYLLSMIRNCLLDSTNNGIAFIMKNIMEDFKLKKEKYICFDNILSKNMIFDNIDIKFSKITCEYLDIFFDLIPLYLNDCSNIELDIYGINTINLEKAISLYKKCFEFLGEFVVVPIGLNNIEERNNFNFFKSGEKDDIISFLNNVSSKYNRYNDFLLENEKYTFLFENALDNIIRNSEAHFDYTYDQLSQIIVFSSMKNNIKKSEKKYMIEFASILLQMYQKCVLIWEMGYQMNKLDKVFRKGIKVTIGTP